MELGCWRWDLDGLIGAGFAEEDKKEMLVEVEKGKEGRKEEGSGDVKNAR